MDTCIIEPQCDEVRRQRDRLRAALKGLLEAYERTAEHPSYVWNVPECVAAREALMASER